MRFDGVVVSPGRATNMAEQGSTEANSLWSVRDWRGVEWRRGVSLRFVGGDVVVGVVMGSEIRGGVWSSMK